MRKKLCSRFPASRIKKIMQADEDVGKIALAVPLLVSKALELFLKDVCDRTYEVTLQSGAKTLNTLHLKQCVKMYSAFDFLTDVVNKVPNLGGTESCGDEKGISRKRKTIEDDGDTVTDDSRFSKVSMTSTNLSPEDRGRGKELGRGQSPLNRNFEGESSLLKYEEEIDLSPEHEDHITESDATEKMKENDSINLSLQPKPDMILSTETKQNEHSTCPSPEAVMKLGIEASKLANINMHTDEDEDYDNEN